MNSGECSESSYSREMYAIMRRMTSQSTVDFGTLRANLDTLAAQYAMARPFPHIVIDDVLTPEAFRLAAKEFPAIGDAFWKGYLHVNETKYGNTYPDTWAPSLRSIAQELTSPEFVALLERLTGISGLLPDWTMDGGGLHQSTRGGFLNIHADFSTHHTHQNWARRVNILLYLNEEWEQDWGGSLELWDRDMTAVQARVTPRGNRMLVFTTSNDSFHGHPDPLACPEGVARRSMALYYFTEEPSVVRRSTNYQPRPEDGLKSVAIRADKHLVDLYDRVKRRLGWSDDRVQDLLGRVHRLRRPR